MTLPATEDELDEVLEFSENELRPLLSIVENKNRNELEGEDIAEIRRMGDKIFKYLKECFSVNILQEHRKKCTEFVPYAQPSKTKFDTWEDKENVVLILWDIAATLRQDFDDPQTPKRNASYFAAENFLKAMQLKGN